MISIHVLLTDQKSFGNMAAKIFFISSFIIIILLIALVQCFSAGSVHLLVGKKK